MQFNLVLNDALHSQDAVQFEWQQLNRWDLLDLSKDFAMLWDGCEGTNGVLRGYREVCGYALGTLGMPSVTIHDVCGCWSIFAAVCMVCFCQPDLCWSATDQNMLRFTGTLLLTLLYTVFRTARYLCIKDSVMHNVGTLTQGHYFSSSFTVTVITVTVMLCSCSVGGANAHHS
jgi:hypothetical protein